MNGLLSKTFCKFLLIDMFMPMFIYINYAKMVLKTHSFIKIFCCLYRSFVSIIRISGNTKQKSTQQLVQTN